MKTTIEKIFSARILALMVAVCATGGAWADFTMTNPVTGEDETYDNKFTGGSDGTGTEWNNSSNWDPSVTPFVSGDYNASLVSNKTVSTSTAIDGYTLRVGAYNGAAVTWSGGITKIQAGTAGCWLTADATSSITLAFNGNNKQLEGSSTYPLKLSSAKAGGITWTSGLASAGNTSLPFWYYLKGAGTVVYGGDITVANAQVIKMADITLSGNAKSVQSKTLVSFGSGTTKTFTADAAIKVYDTDGTTLATTVNLATVNTTGSTTLTTSDPVGTVELVQTSTGVILYYVDGDPADVNVGEKTYKPSISVNFTSGTALSTAGDVGLAGYAVPGTSWNNLTVANNATLSSLNKIDSTGAATASSASVTITNTRGYWTCSSLVAASDMRAGYIDETADVTTPTVTVSGIPYDQYKVVVYTATDAANVAFGYVTINGTDYTYANGAVAEGTAAWGASGAKNTAEALAEGVNVLVSPVVSGGTLTVVGHRSGDNPRGCIAAVQIVKVEQQVGENDLLIELDGDRTYTFSEAKAYSGTVYVTGEGTLTFDGAASTTETLHIGPAAAVNMVGSALTPTTVTGNGTVVYDGVKPTTGLGWTNSANWTGTVWVKNITTSSNERKDWNPALYGNEESTLRFTDVNLYFQSTTTEFSGTVELDAGGLNICDGYGGTKATFAKLTGSGTLSTGGGSSSGNGLMIRDASKFTGTITLTKYKVIIGSSDGTSASGVLQIDSGAVATVASGKTWTAPGGFVVNGTLNANGTLASSHASQAVSGSGTVVFTGRAPTPTGDTWWKNSSWTGTVEIKDVTNMVGASSGFNGTYLDFANYGNEGSKIKISNISGWLPNQTFDGELVLAGTLTINNAISGYVFKVKKLSGNGGIMSNTANNSATTTFQAEDPSAFAGFLAIGYKRVVFGSSLPEGDFVQGQIYVGKGVVVTNQYNANAAWWANNGITIAGELCSPNLSRFGGGTTITTTDTGVFTLVSNSNTDDMNVDYTRIQGTGTLKFEGSAYRCISTNNFPTAMIVENNLTAGLLHRIPNLEVTIGSLSGSGYLRSDWGGSAGDRSLKVLQAKDTTWSGKFWTANPHRFGTLRVAPGVSTAGTLTISATHENAELTALQVDSGAAVNLSGTWVGATTVAGTFGGTGTLKGNLTFSDGATFKANTSALTISGSNTVTFPSEGSVTVDLTSIELSSSGTTLISGASSIANSANLTASGAYFAVEGDGTKSLVAYAHVATYSGVKYATFEAAIAAALADEGGEANLASITVVDATAELPAGYLIVDNNVVKAQGAIVDTEGTAHYYATATAAAADIDSYLGMGNQKTYSYFAVYFGTDVEMSVNLGAMAWNVFAVKVKCLNDATVSVVPDSVEYEFSAGEPDENSIVTYTKSEKATTYVWVGTGESPTSWGNYHKWKIGTSEGAAAARAPSTLDTVIINGGAPISISGVTVAAMQIGGDAKISGSGTLTATTGGIVLTDAAATLTVTGVTLSQDPTSGVDLMYVKATTSEGATTYALQSAGTVEEGVAKITDATAEVTVPANATAIEAAPAVSSIKLADGSAITDSDVTVKYNGTTNITGAFSISVAGDQVTLALNANGSVTISDKTITVKPAVDTSADPMTMPDETTAPSFNIKTIPGLWYSAWSSTTIDASGNLTGSVDKPTDPIQAITTSTEINNGLTEDSVVRYYKIAVGVSKDDVK